MADPKIVKFAAAMQRAMMENQDEKGDSWKETSISALLNGITKNIRAARAHHQRTFEEAPVRKCMVDIANYAMMIFTRMGE